ncbi:MAG: ATP-binding protein [Candidatus Dormibacterales bacterium]
MYEFPHRDEFRDREAELAALEEWWTQDDDHPVMVVYGRRRTGKSWLFRRFADGKDAVIFVCDRRSEGAQIGKFADTLEPVLRFRPALNTMTDLYRVIYGLDGTRLVVIDEFPELCGPRKHPDSELMAVLEEVWGTTQVKVLLCGSQIGTMRNTLKSRAPLHGRARPLQLQALPFHVARGFLRPHAGVELFDRYAIAGGMPRYLNLLNRSGSLKSLICSLVLSPDGTLFQEPRTVLEMELVQTGVYFSLLEGLAKKKEMEWSDLVNESGIDGGNASKYVRVLEDLGIVEITAPAFSPVGNGRRHRYRVKDPLTRFWFRFVFPYQDAMTSDLSPEAHYARNVEPHLTEHVSVAFEDVCRSWAAREYQHTTDSVASWWGNALNEYRRDGTRTSEEIDIVGAHQRKATVLGEVKWTSAMMPKAVLEDLRTYKIPALQQAKIDVTDAQIILISKSGFTKDLETEAAATGVRLVGLHEVLGEAAAK